MRTISKTNNPFIKLNVEYIQARLLARLYIMENNYWSERTFYRKMEEPEGLTDNENAVVATAYKKFIYEPLTRIINEAQNN